MKNTYAIILFFVLLGCSQKETTDIIQSSRNNIVNVKTKIQEIAIPEDDVLIGSNPKMVILNNYLIISDYKSYDKLIHILDKNNFKFVTDVGNRGQGPNEITSIGHIAADETNGKFYVNDHGKLIIFSYDLDSVIHFADYQPVVKMKMKKSVFPSEYIYINDTLSYGRIIEPIGNSDFSDCVAKINMQSGNIEKMQYSNPKIEHKKGISFAVSLSKSIIVEGYHRFDLLTFYNAEGQLIADIYGPNWHSSRDNKHHFGKIEFCDDYLLALYSGGDWNSDQYTPTKFMVFNSKGDYLKTVEVGMKIMDFCCDADNKRVIFNFNDANIQFGYLNFSEFID